MALFTKQISGVVITENDDPITTEITIREALKGRKKSRKPQKEFKKKGEKVEGQLNKEVLDRQRQRRDQLREIKKKVDSDRQKRIQKEREKREEKKQKEKEMKLNNGTYQVIKDNKKIAKWSKKAKQKLLQMPKEDFEKYLESTRKK